MCVCMWVSLLVFLGQAVVVEDATCSLDGRLADYARLHGLNQRHADPIATQSFIPLPAKCTLFTKND